MRCFSTASWLSTARSLAASLALGDKSALTKVRVYFWTWNNARRAIWQVKNSLMIVFIDGGYQNQSVN